MNTRVFTIRTITNLHVGNESGGEFTIIDKSVQRDPLTGLPCINSSSIKGAIKEFCVHKTSVDVGKIFGSDVDKVTGKVKAETQKGEAIFYDAKLLLLPQQDEDTLYHYITTKSIFDKMKERIELLGSGVTFTMPEKYPAGETGKRVEPVNDDKMVVCCSDDNLPIIARNVLENGESKNLWYEQVLPAETVFFTIIQEEGDALAKALDGQIIQIGANATIGYGYCKFELLK